MMSQTKDILCSGARLVPEEEEVLAVAQPAAAEDADAEDAANAEKTPKKNDVSATITLFCSAAGAEGVEQDGGEGVAVAVAAKLAAVAKLAVAKLATAAKHAPTATQNH